MGYKRDHRDIPLPKMGKRFKETKWSIISSEAEALKKAKNEAARILDD